jgi:DNA modification methylase
MRGMADDSVHLTVTSPPYNKKGLLGKVKSGNQIWKKFNIDYDSYGDDMAEEDYIKWQKEILTELYRITAHNGSCFYNHKMRRKNNDCYPPWVLFDGTPWKFYQMIILDRRNSPNIRNDILVPCTEYLFWLTKGKPTVHRNNIPKEFRSEVWVIPPKRQEGHPAPMHPTIPEVCINLTTVPGNTVFDPFAGIGTVAEVARRLRRKWAGFEISKNYFDVCIANNLNTDEEV